MAKIQGFGFQIPCEAEESPEDLAKNVDSCVLSPEILTLFGGRGICFCHRHSMVGILRLHF